MKSIQFTFKLLAMLLAGITILAMSGLWIYDDFVEYHLALDEIEERYLLEQKKMLEKEVSSAISYIEYKKQKVEHRLRATVRQHTLEAIAIVERITAKDSKLQDGEMQAAIIREILGSIKYNNGSGNYFIINSQGDEELPMAKAQVVPPASREIINILQQIGRLRADGGFYTYPCSRKNSNGALCNRIAFVRRFDYFDWTIGSSENLNRVMATTQQEVIDRIEKIRFGTGGNGYVFVVTYDGKALSGPGKGKNMLNVQDANGKYIVRELIKTARQGHGYVEYVMPAIDGRRSAPKLSYVAGIDDWQWYVGAGIYMDELAGLIKPVQQQFADRLKNNLTIIGFIFVCLFILNYLLSSLLARRIGRNIDIFFNFFRKAATESIGIEVNALQYSEFKQIAVAANQMLTERNLVLQEVRDARDEWAGTFNAIEDGVFLLDSQGNLLQANDAAMEQVGKTFQEIEGCHFSVFCCENSPIQYTLEDSRVHRSEVICPNSKRLYHTASFPMLLNDRLQKIVVISRDISEHRNLEMQLHHAQKMESVGRLAGGVAHDFNNILCVINGYAELCLTRLSVHDSMYSDVRSILDAGLKAGRLTSQLLAFSRKQIVKKEFLDLNRELAENEKMLGRLIGEDISLHYSKEDRLWLVEMDRTQWEQVVINLAVNARDAMPTGGTLTMETANCSLDQEYADQHLILEPGDYVRFSISDSGAGMDAETVERIFEPFFTTKEEGRGTGLGLATVHGIVKQNGGEILVYSEPDQGTVFTVYLPRARQDAADPVQEQISKGMPPQLGQETILLVEDEEMVRRMAAKVLAGHGYTVFEAENGEQALKMVAGLHGTVDLLLTDVVMPGMSGAELAEKLLKIMPELPVLYMSGYTENAIIQRGVLLEEINFIQKPLTSSQLVREVFTVLKQEQNDAGRGQTEG